MRILTIDSKKDKKNLAETPTPVDISTFKKQEIRTLIRDMRETMKRADGVGLSANQIGFDMQLFVAEVPGSGGDRPKFYAIFNPKITKLSKQKTPFEEGCLSVPLTFGIVERPERITLEGFDQNGKKMKIKAWGFLARVFQHEVDHLNGHLFIEKAKKLHTIEPTIEPKKEK